MTFQKKKKIKIISHKKNIGKGAAIKSAKKFVRGSIIIIQDADLEYDPKDYFKLIKPIKEKKCKVVYGSRVLNKIRYNAEGFTSIFRIFGNHLLTEISNLLNNQNLSDAHTCYKVLTKDIFFNIKLQENGFEFCPELTSKIARLNIEIKEVPISYRGRNYEDGKKIKLKHAFKAFYTLFKYRFFK